MSLIGKAKSLVAEQHSFRASYSGSQLDARLARAVEALITEMNQRELHHFEAEQALASIKRYIGDALFFGDDLDHEDILNMIPEDI